MKKLVLASLCATALVAALPAQATVHYFTASLSSLGEPVPTSTATGFANFAFDDVALSVFVSESWTGISASMTGNHIHCCTAVAGTGSAGVALNFTGLSAATTGSYSNTFTLSASSFASLLAGSQAGKAYVNIHTPSPYQAGEIRGWLVAEVPEPATYGLMLAGLGLVGVIARRRRG